MIEIYVVVVLVIIAIICFLLKKSKIELFSESRKLYNIVNDKFKNNISYVDYVKLTKVRDPIIYFELKQLYNNKENVTEKDIEYIMNKYKKSK